MSSLLKLTINEMHNGLKNGDFSAVELTEAHIEAIERESINAFILKTPEIARDAAKKADHKYRNKENINPLLGIPIGIKDLFCTKGIRTTACSKILYDFIPQYESTVTAKLWSAGAVMMGKINMDEFAMGSSNMTSCFGPALNPLKRHSDTKDLVPGGSSGGSAASVAAFLCAGALGSDTGGSVRQPAAFCGVVGVKPTYGRCSRWGMVSFSSSLDQAGVLARTVQDAALILESICGYDEKDYTTSKIAVPQFSNALDHSIQGKRIGVPKEYIDSDLPDEILNTLRYNIKLLEESGAEIIDISLPHTRYALPIYSIISSAEASANLSRYDGVRYGLRTEANSIHAMYMNTRSDGFGEEVRRRIINGAYSLAFDNYEPFYQKAQKVRQLITNDFQNVFGHQIDYIITPTTQSDAFALDEKPSTSMMYMNDIFTVPPSLAGLPVIAVPSGKSKRGMPLSMQIIGNYNDESGILNIARIMEKSQ